VDCAILNPVAPKAANKITKARGFIMSPDRG
jgi:hypothetical protein